VSYNVCLFLAATQRLKDRMRCLSEEAPPDTNDELVRPCGVLSIISDNTNSMSPVGSSTSALPFIASEVEPRNGISFLQDIVQKNKPITMYQINVPNTVRRTRRQVAGSAVYRPYTYKGSARKRGKARFESQ
jgi:hypothetical protein